MPHIIAAYSQGEWEEWYHEPRTVAFFQHILKDREKTIDSLLNFQSSGENLTREYYFFKGIVAGLESSHIIAKKLLKGDEDAKKGQ